MAEVEFPAFLLRYGALAAPGPQTVLAIADEAAAASVSENAFKAAMVSLELPEHG